jgi:hypothetical protein
MAWTAPITWTTGQVVTAAQMNTNVRDNLNALSTALLLPQHITGRYYTSVGAAGGPGTPSANDLYATPITIPNSGSYDRIAVNVTTNAADNARLGIYNDNNGSPGSLVLDFGTVSLNTGGVREITISQALAGPQQYWLAVFIQAGLAALTVIGGVLGGSSSGGSAGGANGVHRSLAYAALPDPFGTITGVATTPAVSLRRV